MTLFKFIQETELKDKLQVVKAKLLCYFHHKTRNKNEFLISEIVEFFEDAGLNKPNSSRIKSNLVKEKVLKLKKGSKKDYVFIPTTLSSLDEEYTSLFITEEVESNSELLDESKFCGKRGYLTKLIQQINSSYRNNCHDACAVLMRRLFEVSLILVYRKHGVENQIQDANGDFKYLDTIIKDAVQNSTLKLSRIKKEYNNIKMVGNFSAHRIEYNASKKDIDDIKIVFRTALEELYIKAGL